MMVHLCIDRGRTILRLYSISPSLSTIKVRIRFLGGVRCIIIICNAFKRSVFIMFTVDEYIYIYIYIYIYEV